MNTLNSTVPRRTTAVRIQRLLAVLSLAIALVAIPMLSPTDASAMRMSEGAANRACARAGGTIHYGFLDPRGIDYDMTCTLPSGNVFVCIGHLREVFCL